MKNISKGFSLITTLFVFSCKPLPPINYNEINFGKKPAKQQAIQLIKKEMEKTLIDPKSAMYYDFTEPTKWAYYNPYRNEEVLYGWVVCFGINSKNSYGGYTGRETYSALFWGDNNEFIIDIDKSFMMRDHISNTYPC